MRLDGGVAGLGKEQPGTAIPVVSCSGFCVMKPVVVRTVDFWFGKAENPLSFMWALLSAEALFSLVSVRSDPTESSV